MYNFNDITICAEPYVNLKRTGIIVGILPYDLRKRSKYMVSIVKKCIYSDAMRNLIYSKNSNINNFFFEEVLRHRYNIDFFRIFYLDGCTILAVECPRFYSYHGTKTWENAASKYIKTIKFNRACIRLCNRRKFKSDLNEYDFLVDAIELGGISTIHIIAEENPNDLMIQAFQRAAIETNIHVKPKKVAPTYSRVMHIQKKLISRWGVNENILDVFDRPVVSINAYKEINIGPRHAPVFNGFTAKDVIK